MQPVSLVEHNFGRVSLWVVKRLPLAIVREVASGRPSLVRGDLVLRINGNIVPRSITKWCTAGLVEPRMST